MSQAATQDSLASLGENMSKEEENTGGVFETKAKAPRILGAFKIPKRRLPDIFNDKSTAAIVKPGISGETKRPKPRNRLGAL